MDKRLKFTPKQKKLIKELQKLFGKLYDNNIGYIVCTNVDDWNDSNDWYNSCIAFYNEEYIDWFDYTDEPYVNEGCVHISDLKHASFIIDGFFNHTDPMVELENNDYVRNRIRRRYNKMLREKEAADREAAIYHARMKALGEPYWELMGVRSEMEVIKEVLKSLNEDLERWESGNNQKIIDITREDILENEKKLTLLLEQESVLKPEVDKRLEEFNKNFNQD